MNDHDDERLSLFLDGALPPAEAEEVERLVATDPEWKAAHRALKITGEMLRAPVERAAKAAEFDTLWGGIEAGLPAAPAAPSLWERLRGFISPPVLIGLAAAAAVAVYVASRPGPSPAPGPGVSPSPATPANPGLASASPPSAAPASALAVAPAPVPEESEPVIIEGIESGGSKTVLVSQPAEPNGATIIWLLDAPDAAPANGSTPPSSDDDPI